MLLAENRLVKIALVDEMFQVVVRVGFRPVGHEGDDDAPQSGNTTGPVSSVMLEIMWM